MVRASFHKAPSCQPLAALSQPQGDPDQPPRGLSLGTGDGHTYRPMYGHMDRFYGTSSPLGPQLKLEEKGNWKKCRKEWRKTKNEEKGGKIRNRSEKGERVAFGGAFGGEEIKGGGGTKKEKQKRD